MLPAATNGHDAEREQRELQVEEEQHGDRADQRQPGLEERHDRVGDEAFQRLDVVGDARDQHPRGAALVEADRLALQVGEDADAQVGQRALADPADEVGLQVGHHPHQQRGGEERDHDQHQRAAVVALDALSIAALASSGGASEAAVPSTSALEHRGDAQPVGAQQRQQAAQVAPTAARGWRARRPTAAPPRPMPGPRPRRAPPMPPPMRPPPPPKPPAAHRPLTSRSRVSRVRKTCSGRPFSTISR